MEQSVIMFNGGYKNIKDILKEHKSKHTLIVCGSSFNKLSISKYFDSIDIPHTFFHNFTPNPKIEDINNGTETFRRFQCDSIISVGGGSSIDVAKCIRHFCNNDDIVHIAIPTTAGSGSESTTFAVAYKNGVKHSIECKIPNYAVLEESTLETLPLLQKISTMFDALCQSIESLWSKLGTEESRYFAKECIKLILNNHNGYLTKDKPYREVLRNMMRAANFSGKAINISKTTAAHAMSYGITSMFGTPHGYAVALCLAPVWRLMEKRNLYNNNLNELITVELFEELLNTYSISPPPCHTEEQIMRLSATVNAERMSNNPVFFDSNDIIAIYRNVFPLKKEETM